MSDTIDRPMPWDVMSGMNVKPQHRTNLTAALKAAGMDYQVEVWDTQAVRHLDGGRQTLNNPKAAQIVRPINGELTVVGSTGRRFTPIQNLDAFGVAEDLVGDFGASIDGLADFRHGGASIMSLDLGKPIDLVRPDGKDDPLNTFLLVKNAHDGSSALTFALTVVRLPCTNALPATIKGAERVWKISHTPNAAERVNLARQSILRAVGYQERFTAVAQDMMDTEMVDAEFAKIVAQLWPVKDDAEGKVADRKRAIQDELLALYRESVTLDGIRGTRWGGYNAVTEYLDHYRPVKGDAKVARAEGALEGPNVRVKGNIWRQFATA